MLKLSPNEFNIDSGQEDREERMFRMRDGTLNSKAHEQFMMDRAGREGPVPKKDILQEALDMARRRPPQKPLEIENLPPQTVQTKLPEELTAGATVADRDFRDVKFPSLR